MRLAVVGASAGLGRALADRSARAGHDLVLVASDEADIGATAADLEIRHRVRALPVVADAADADPYLERLQAAAARLGGLDGLLFPIGAIDADDGVRLEAPSAARLVAVNFLAVAATVARFLAELEGRERAVIVGFGSIAAIRGRGANAVYAASKRALESYFESLRHALAGSGVIVQFYVLGYLDTGLAFGKRTLLPRAHPDRVSARIVRDLGRDVGVVYLPGFWRPIAAVLRRVPWPVYRRMQF